MIIIAAGPAFAYSRSPQPSICRIGHPCCVPSRKASCEAYCRVVIVSSPSEISRKRSDHHECFLQELGCLSVWRPIPEPLGKYSSLARGIVVEETTDTNTTLYRCLSRRGKETVWVSGGTPGRVGEDAGNFVPSIVFMTKRVTRFCSASRRLSSRPSRRVSMGVGSPHAVRFFTHHGALRSV